MHPADIKAALIKAGTNQSGVAKTLGVTPTTVHQVIGGRCHSRRIAEAIADITGYSIDQLWPGEYQERAA